MNVFSAVSFAALIMTCEAMTSGVSRVSKIKGAYFGAVVGDALTLGTHYEYDATRIRKFYGRIDRFYAPGEKTGGQTHGVGWGARNYHGGNGRGPPKRAGENTDYGDYNRLILEHLALTTPKGGGVTPPIDLSALIPRWKRWLKTWRAWMCTQTKQTKQQIDQGMPLDRVGGRSNAMAIRNAASFAFYKDEEANVEASRTAMFTHRERTALDGGAFFTRVTHRIIWEGMKPREAIEAVAALPSSSAFVKRKVQQALDKVQEATDPTKALSKDEYVDDKALTSMARLWEVGKTEPIKVGKASPTEGTLPGSVYFIVKYEDDLRGALQANAEVGGDNASRGVAIGMVLGAYHGVEAIPPEWGKGNLVEWESGETLLQKAPLLSTEAEL